MKSCAWAAFAAGQMDTRGAHDGVVSGGQPLDEIVRLGRLRRRDHIGIRGAVAAAAYVVRDAFAKQVEVLEHQAQLRHELVGSHRAHVGAAYADAAAIDVPETREEVRERRFARAGRPDDCAHASGGHGEAHVLERLRAAFLVREDHVLELHRCIARGLRFAGGGKLVELQHRIDAADARAGDHGVLAHIEDLLEHARYRMHEQQVEDEREDEGRPVVRSGGEQDAYRQDKQVGTVEQRGEARHGVLEEERDVQRQPRVVLDGLGELPERACGLSERLDDAHATHVFDGGVAHFLLDLLVAPHLAHEALVGVARELHDAGNGDRDDGRHAEAPVEHEEQHDEHDGRDGGGGQIGDRVPDELLYAVDRLVHDLGDASRSQPGDVPQRHLAQMVDDADLDAVLRVERSRMRAQQRAQVAPHIGDDSRQRQHAVARELARVERRQVRIDGHDRRYRRIDGDVGHERRRRGQRGQQHRQHDEGLARPGERHAAREHPGPFGLSALAVRGSGRDLACDPGRRLDLHGILLFHAVHSLPAPYAMPARSKCFLKTARPRKAPMSAPTMVTAAMAANVWGVTNESIDSM